ncbi:hypothetical protein C4K00_2909 [Pseudomonas synxantha]|uniref:hypothetical protein n=1 Tax=Pseudomonas synxantha TaxID=47883 RepID=UPI000F70BC4E|nr:hypothetical protein [Pseudomonas synxantha]AZE73137.1 hypothetical protein C4K00_2909 [Pseudomonas synxantha]
MASWFLEGTVTVTNGNAVVTGLGTKFSNCRAGDMFVGPDNGIYQVINPSSDTSVSISPAYRGATSAGAAYGIVPINGYPKALADAVNQMVQQWGATLAGLGSVSTENIVPFSKGGLGSNSKVAAKAALDLGTASSGTLSTSQLDGTANRVQKWGDWGLGTSDVPVAASVNIAYSGFSRWDSTTAFYSNYGAISGSIISAGFPGESCAQVFIGRSAKTLAGFRSGDGGFYFFYHTGNTTKSADGTLKAL